MPHLRTPAARWLRCVPSTCHQHAFGHAPCHRTTGAHICGTNYRHRQLAAAAGGRRLGCSLYEVPPGKAAWPRHAHLANEEAIIVVAGTGTLRLGDHQSPVRAGDYIALPAGEAHAHQLINTGAETLRYYCLSTMIEPDVMLYPDSGKLGVFAGAAPGGPKAARTFSTFLRTDAPVDYWDGEASHGDTPGRKA